MGNYRITPPVGTMHIFVDGRLVKSKVHNTRYNRESYATQMIIKYSDSIIDFVFNDGLREIHMYTHDPKKVFATQHWSGQPLRVYFAEMMFPQNVIDYFCTAVGQCFPPSAIDTGQHCIFTG